MTVMSVVALVLAPTLFLHVSVYVVAPTVVRLSVCQDVVVILVGPFGPIEQLLVLAVDHESMLVLLAVTVEGVAVNRLIVGADTTVTTAVWDTTFTPSPQVSVKVVLVLSAPVCHDVSVELTGPPGATVHDVALVVVQESVLLPPLAILEGLAVNELIAGNIGLLTTTSLLEVLLLPAAS